MKSKNIPLITIAIPTYNRAQSYLKTTLESALDQTYKNIELIVSDNNSTDNTAELVNGYKDPRIRYYRHYENIGAWNNFNFCLEKARGDYFMILCDDDLIDADFLEVCMKHAQYRTDIGFISTGSRIIDECGMITRQKVNHANGLSNSDFILLWYNRGIHLFLCSSLFNTRFLKNEGGFKVTYNLFLDVATEFQIAIQYGRVDIPDVKASFREHRSSYTNTVSRISEWCDNSIQLLDLACSLVPHDSDKIRRVGLKTSAIRNYRYASEVEKYFIRIKLYWIVFKKFGYRYPPLSKDSIAIFPGLRYIYHPAKTFKKLKKIVGL